MATIPPFEHDKKHDVHAPASTYYTTGDNARQRTRTHTVNKIDLNFPL
jgi:alpha,alpha-trehalase